MAIKICKICKKPMKANDTNCRTCGAEYKNNSIVLIAIILIVLGGLFFCILSFFSKDENSSHTVGVNSESSQKAIPTKWVMEDNTDKMTDKKSFYLFNKAVNAETGTNVDAGMTIGCSYYGGLNAVFTTDAPIKTRTFTKEGPVGEYSIRFDDKPVEVGKSSLSSLNRVFVLADNHVNEIEGTSKILIRVTTGADNYKTYEVNSSGGEALFVKMKEFCLNKAKDKKEP